MKKKEVRQLLDLLQLLADEPSTPVDEQREMLLDFGYYTAYLEHSIKFDCWDKRRLEMLKQKYMEIKDGENMEESRRDCK